MLPSEFELMIRENFNSLDSVVSCYTKSMKDFIFIEVKFKTDTYHKMLAIRFIAKESFSLDDINNMFYDYLNKEYEALSGKCNSMEDFSVEFYNYMKFLEDYPDERPDGYKVADTY